MFVEIDVKRCVGCGMCEDNHPGMFTMGSRYAIVTHPIVPEEARESVKQTAQDCPADAIIITEHTESTLDG